jgi:hypothetical protein
MNGVPLVLAAVALPVVAALVSGRGSAADDGCLTLGDLIDVGRDLQDSDFWLTSKGRPSRTASTFGIKVRRTDVLVPQYLYYVLEYLADQGQWTNRKVTEAAIRAIRVQQR